jgi:casein kinase I family protein HRR25
MNTHQGYEQGRRDDLESLFYIIIYFIKGELPWQNIKSKTRLEKYGKIYEIKKKVTENGDLCEGLPLEMKKILDYILGLNFSEKPNYLMLKNAVNGILNKLNLSNDLQFDWYNLDFLNYLYISLNNNNDEKESSKKENKSEKNKNNETNKEVKKLNTINNVNQYNPKKLKNSYIKNNENINNSFVRGKNNQMIQERSKSLTTLKRMYAQKLSKKNINEYKKIKTFLEGKKEISKQNKELNGKEKIKIKNLRIKK